MKPKYRWQIVSGMCVCGHSYEDHHLGFIMNEDTLRDLPADHPLYLPQECEFFGCNEGGGLDEEGNDHCQQYIDKEFYS